MKHLEAQNYCCPVCQLPLKVTITAEEQGEVIEGQFVCASGHLFDIKEGIPDFTWPKELADVDQKTRAIYDKLAEEYDKFALFPFMTFKADEGAVRKKMTDALNITESSVILEIGAGDGRGAEHIAKRLGPKGKFYVQELSPSFLKKSLQRLAPYKDKIEFSYANASYLPFPDNHFDAAHHFGGISTFGDVKRCLKELARVVKPGGKVLVGDESMGPWLRDTEFGKIMCNSNPLFKYELPLNDIPVEARDVKVEWIMMNAFFLLEFTIGEGVPEAEYHMPIPSERGGTHWTRFYGHLEGVSDEAKKLAYEAREKNGISMHDWLDKVVREAALNDLKK